MNNFVIVKDRNPRISEVLNDCIQLCVPTYKNEPLSSILQKMCIRIDECCGTSTGGGGTVYDIQAGDNITITGVGSLADPWIISTTDEGGGAGFPIITLDSVTLDLVGNGTISTPLYGNVNVANVPNQAIQILPTGLFVPNTIQAGIVYGGIVTWLEDYDYHVSAAGYWLDFQFHESPAANFTLAPPDGTFNRLDTFILNASNSAAVLQGTPSINPAQAPLDPATQLEISIALVEVGTTQPTLSAECLYRNNAEWGTTSSNIVRINPDSTTLPCNSTKAIEATGVVSGDNILLTRGSSFNPTTLHSQIDFYARSKGTFGANGVTFQWELVGVPVGNPITLNQGSFGFDSLDSSTCQLVAIPLFQFGLNTTTTVDSLRITGLVTSGTLGFYLDDICLQGQPLPPLPTSLDEKFKRSSADTTPGFFNQKVLAGTGITFTVANPGANETVTISASTTALTFDNAVTRTLDNVQLGGTLLHNTTVATTPAFSLIVSGDVPSATNSGTLIITNLAATGTAVYAQTNAGISVFGDANTGTGVLGISTSGVGGTFQSTSNSAIYGSAGSASLAPIVSQATNTTLNTDTPGFQIFKQPAGTAANNIGSSIEFLTKTDGGSTPLSHKIVSRFTDVVHASRDSQFEIWGVNAAITELQLTLKSTGQLQLPNYDGVTFTGVPTGILAVDTNGNVIETSLGGATVDNGLNENPATNFRLGGPLVEPTTIDSSGFKFLITDNIAFGFLTGSLVVENTSSGNALRIFADSGYGITATTITGDAAIQGYAPNDKGVRGDTDTGFGGSFLATASGIGVTAGSDSGVGGIITSTSGSGLFASTQTGTYGASIGKGDSGAAAVTTALQVYGNQGFGVGTGVAIEMAMNFNGGLLTGTKFISRATTTTLGTSQADFVLQMRTGNALYDALSIIGATGAQKWGGYGAGAITGTGAFGLAVDATGNVIEIALGGGGGGTVNSVAGTTNQITSTGGTDPIIGISASYAGQASIITLGTVTTGTWQGTAIGQTFGGTGFTTYTTGQILYSSAANTLSKLNIGTSGQVLTVVAGVPGWTTLSGTGTVVSVSGGTTGLTFSNPTTAAVMTGTLGVPNGGTGLTSVVQGDTFFGSGVNVISKLGKSVTPGHVLTNGGAGNNPAWGQVSLTTSVTGRLPFANLVQVNARSVMGNPTAATADLTNIAPSAGGQVLRSDPSNTTIGFGSLNLASANTVGTSILGIPNGGLGTATVTSGRTIITTATGFNQAIPTGTLGITVTMGSGSMNTSLTANPTRQSLTDTPPITWNFDNGIAATVILANIGRTVVFAGTPIPATTYTLEVRQDGVGSRTITTWPAGILWEGGVTPTLSTGASKIDLFTFYHTTGGQYLGKLVGRFN